MAGERAGAGTLGGRSLACGWPLLVFRLERLRNLMLWSLLRQGLAAATVRNPTVRMQQRHNAPQKRLSRESAFSGKLWHRATYFQMVARHHLPP